MDQLGNERLETSVGDLLLDSVMSALREECPAVAVHLGDGLRGFRGGGTVDDCLGLLGVLNECVFALHRLEQSELADDVLAYARLVRLRAASLIGTAVAEAQSAIEAAEKKIAELEEAEEVEEAKKEKDRAEEAQLEEKIERMTQDLEEKTRALNKCQSELASHRGALGTVEERMAGFTDEDVLRSEREALTNQLFGAKERLREETAREERLHRATQGLNTVAPERVVPVIPFSGEGGGGDLHLFGMPSPSTTNLLGVMPSITTTTPPLVSSTSSASASSMSMALSSTSSSSNGRISPETSMDGIPRSGRQRVRPSSLPLVQLAGSKRVRFVIGPERKPDDLEAKTSQKSSSSSSSSSLSFASAIENASSSGFLSGSKPFRNYPSCEMMVTPEKQPGSSKSRRRVVSPVTTALEEASKCWGDETRWGRVMERVKEIGPVAAVDAEPLLPLLVAVAGFESMAVELQTVLGADYRAAAENWSVGVAGQLLEDAHVDVPASHTPLMAALEHGRVSLADKLVAGGDDLGQAMVDLAEADRPVAIGYCASLAGVRKEHAQVAVDVATQRGCLRAVVSLVMNYHVRPQADTVAAASKHYPNLGGWLDGAFATPVPEDLVHILPLRDNNVLLNIDLWNTILEPHLHPEGDLAKVIRRALLIKQRRPGYGRAAVMLARHLRRLSNSDEHTLAERHFFASILHSLGPAALYRCPPALELANPSDLADLFFSAVTNNNTAHVLLHALAKENNILLMLQNATSQQVQSFAHTLSEQPHLAYVIAYNSNPNTKTNTDPNTSLRALLARHVSSELLDEICNRVKYWARDLSFITPPWVWESLEGKN